MLCSSLYRCYYCSLFCIILQSVLLLLYDVVLTAKGGGAAGPALINGMNMMRRSREACGSHEPFLRGVAVRA